MFSIINALANVIPGNCMFLINPISCFITCTGRGVQFSRTPSTINTSSRAALYVNVNGKGPAKRLASFQSAKGDPVGRLVSCCVVSMAISMPDLLDCIMVWPAVECWVMSVWT